MSGSIAVPKFEQLKSERRKKFSLIVFFSSSTFYASFCKKHKSNNIKVINVDRCLLVCFSYFSYFMPNFGKRPWFVEVTKMRPAIAKPLKLSVHGLELATGVKPFQLKQGLQSSLFSN